MPAAQPSPSVAFPHAHWFPRSTSHPDDYTGYYYGPDHPMKPQRMAMTHQLVLGYGLHKHLDVYVRICCAVACRY